jgi:pimeloyl-ACP methyl ester carboxylesterase
VRLATPRSSRVRRLLLLAASALGLAAAAVPLPAAAAVPDTPAASSPGLNDYSCRPDAAHPYPVVLVHGTFGSAASAFTSLSPAIRAAGYCVFALDYGNHATGPMERSARELAAFVNGVLAATRAARVLFVGHSQGGLMPRYYLRFLGGAARTAGLVGLAPSNHGTVNPFTPVAGLFCEACEQQFAGSDFLVHLNAGRDVEAGVRYTVISTIFDEVVVPYSSQFLAGPASQVTDVTLQHRCPVDLSEHLRITSDPVARQWVLNALARGGLADPGFRPAC